MAELSGPRPAEDEPCCTPEQASACCEPSKKKACCGVPEDSRRRPKGACDCHAP
jgi:hypothetical protein